MATSTPASPSSSTRRRQQPPDRAGWARPARPRQAPWLRGARRRGLPRSLPVVDRSRAPHDRGPQAALSILAQATGRPAARPTVWSRRRIALCRGHGGRGPARSRVKRSGIRHGRAARRSALDRAGWPLACGERGDATTRGAAAPPERRRERRSLGPVPIANASSATASRAWHRRPRRSGTPCGPPARRVPRCDAHRNRVAGWGERRGLAEQGAASPRGEGDGWTARGWPSGGVPARQARGTTSGSSGPSGTCRAIGGHTSAGAVRRRTASANPLVFPATTADPPHARPRHRGSYALSLIGVEPDAPSGEERSEEGPIEAG